MQTPRVITIKKRKSYRVELDGKVIFGPAKFGQCYQYLRDSGYRAFEYWDDAWNSWIRDSIN